MRILVIPTTDWIRHPVPNRLNFIFDILAERHEIYVLHFQLKRFKELKPRNTRCKLVKAGWIEANDPSLYYLLNSPFHLLKIMEVVRQKGIDVILSSNILPSFMANFAGVPVVFDYLDHLEESASVYYPDSLFSKAVKAGVGAISRYNIAHARSVITVTEEFKSYLKGIGGSDITVIPNGVDLDVLKPMPKDEAKKKLGLKGHVLGYVGSLEHWVDLETVVQAMPYLDASLVIVGPGLFTDYGDKIRKMAEDLEVADRVIFKGAVEYEDLAVHISSMDIGLNPLKKMKKNEETVGGKVFNYLACGRPVLSSRMVALERLLGNEIYYYDDARSFVAEVEEILRLEQNEKKYVSFAKKFNWRTLAKNYEVVLGMAVQPSLKPN